MLIHVSTLWRAVGRAKDWQAPIANQTPIFDAISLTICSSESWPGSFIAGPTPSFSIKQFANPTSNWVLFIKRSSTYTLVKLHCCPEKQTASTVHVTLCSSGSWTRLFFPYNQIHTYLGRFFSSKSRAGCRMKSIDGCALALAPVDVYVGMLFWVKCPYKEFHPSWCCDEMWSKMCVFGT